MVLLGASAVGVSALTIEVDGRVVCLLSFELALGGAWLIDSQFAWLLVASLETSFSTLTAFLEGEVLD